MFAFQYCLLKGLIPKDIAKELAEALLAEHPPMDSDAPAFSLIFGCMSRNDLTWQYCTCHPSAVEVVQHFCGPDITAGEAVCSRLPPGAPAGGLHKDCAQDFVNGHPDTQCCWGVNGIWMLTDFTEENGATHVGASWCITHDECGGHEIGLTTWSSCRCCSAWVSQISC